MSKSENPIRRIFDFICQEPLVPFALIGGILFALYGFQNPTARERIEIQPQTLRALEEMEVEMRGRSLTESERQLLIDSHIEDEVLLREAYRQELEKKDSRVRKRLLNVMRSSLDEPVAEPTQAQLQQYYQQESGKYESGNAYRFDQVYFSFGAEPVNNDRLLQSLNDGEDHRRIGEQHYLGSTVKQITPNQIRRTFGQTFYDEFLTQEFNVWAGPLEARDGFHFIRILGKEEIPRPTFEQLEEFLRHEWMFKQRRQVQTRKIAELTKRYDIDLVGQE